MNFKFSFIIFGLYLYISDMESKAEEPTAFCFKFTWLGPMQDDSKNIKVNCTKLKDSPCFEPFIVTNDSTAPNLVYMWEKHKARVSCPLRPGYVCIKHTFTYNNAVINSTHFCGKMIEDKTTAVSSGCFSQQVDGHTIKSCACQSDGGRLPCNSAKINHYSFLFLFFILFFFANSVTKF